MRMTLPAGLALAAGLLAGCGSAPSPGALPVVIPPGPTSPPAATAPGAVITRTPAPAPAATRHRPRPGTLLAIASEGRVTYSVTLHPGQCHARDEGRLPDPSCTPGSVDPAVTQSAIHRTICVSGWTATVRPPSSQTTRAKYGVARPAYGSTVPGELDHLIPLELGGSNDITNLWPEIYAGTSGARSKDTVENQLRAAVCSGRVKLAAAQLAVAHDWMTAEQITGMK